MRVTLLGLGFAVAFGAGFALDRLVTPAEAQSGPPALTAQIINLPALTDDEIGPKKGPFGMRNRLLVNTPEGTVSVQQGAPGKHFHADSNEIQYILAGHGTFWLGNEKREVKPGDFIIIPKGTPHAGGASVDGEFRAISIKLPPQQPDDSHPVK